MVIVVIVVILLRQLYHCHNDGGKALGTVDAATLSSKTGLFNIYCGGSPFVLVISRPNEVSRAGVSRREHQCLLPGTASLVNIL